MDKQESRIQQECFLWYFNRYCRPPYTASSGIIFHVPNEGQHKLTNIGVLAGVADLVVIHSGRVVFVEVKAEKGRQSSSQLEFQQRVQLQSLGYWLVRSLEDFKRVVNISFGLSVD